MAFNYGDALEFCKDNNWEDTSLSGLRKANRIINAARSALSAAGQWDFDKRFARLVFEAMQATGTLEVTAGQTNVIGTGTNFLGPDIEKQIRVNGESLSYEILTRASTTVITMEAYRGTTAAAATYQMTQPRVAMPTRFRSFAKPSGGDGLYELRPLPDVRELWRMRRQEKSVSVPRYYAIEWRPVTGAGLTPAPHIWVYPDPSVQYVIDLAHYVWPDKVSASADLFNLPNIEAAYYVLQQFILAGIEKENKSVHWMAMAQHAEAEARKILPAFRALDEDTQRDCYVDPEDAGDSLRTRLASGISGYGDS